MPHYFFPIAGDFFHQRIRPTLAQCCEQRSLSAGVPLFKELLPRIRDYHASYGGLAATTLIEQAIDGLSFDSDIWRAVVGEMLLFAAEELPLLQTSPRSLCCLLAPHVLEKETPRSEFAPIQQALFGSKDLVFGGGYYRPDFAALNDGPDVARLAAYLEQIDCGLWQSANLTALNELADEEEREDELAFVRQNWPALVQMYSTARDKAWVVVCEVD